MKTFVYLPVFISVYVVVNVYFQLNFIFPLFLSMQFMVMYTIVDKNEGKIKFKFNWKLIGMYIVKMWIEENIKRNLKMK